MEIESAATFSLEDNLPSLPVPSLESTISKYLLSSEAILDEEEFQKTKEVCKEFLKSPKTLKLQKLLIEKGQKSRNWLEDWWLEFAYLQNRFPLPLSNYSGASPYHEHQWIPKESSQLERAALNIHIILKFWNALRHETLPCQVKRNGSILSMNQLRYIFNTCRRPRANCDQLINCFKTCKEGETPSHVIVLKRGHIYKIKCFDDDKQEPKSCDVIYAMLLAIDEQVVVRGDNVALMTSLPRDHWGQLRQYLMDLSEENKRLLEEIESSVVVISLDEMVANGYEEISKLVSFGNFDNRWYDKSYNGVVFENGLFGSNCDHTPSDALVMAVMSHFHVQEMAKIPSKIKNKSLKLSLGDLPEKLNFVCDETIRDGIHVARQQARDLQHSIEVIQPVFKHCGKNYLKKLKFSPSFMVQLTVQLTYMQIHGVPAPTYETASTRAFYHGRTETCRTCTPQVVHFCRELMKSEKNGIWNYQKLKDLLVLAHDTYLWLMKECENMRGCDRHLMALSILASQHQLDLPIFTDPSFTKTGGNGNFLLSTSCLGFSYIQGVVAPMVANGYGFFYRIDTHRIIYGVTSYNSDPSTSAQKFSDRFQYNFNLILTICNQSQL